LPSPPIPISERERGKGMRDTNKEKWYKIKFDESNYAQK
jgi:hypothetical protein